MTARRMRALRNRKAHAAGQAVALGRAIDPLDEPPMVEPRPELKRIPWNKVELSDEAREQVGLALLEGHARNEIARALGTTVATLRRLIKQDARLSDAVEVRKDIEEAELKDMLTGMARRGDTVAAIFLAKAQFGWRDRDDGKAKSEGGTPGVLVLPAVGNIEDFEAAAYRQQAKWRERKVED